MSTKNENNLGDQEIDLRAISKSFKN